MKKEKLSEKSVRNYLQKISEGIEKISRQQELHVSGENHNFYLLSSLSFDDKAFFVNLAIIAKDKETQAKIDTELFEWLTKHPLSQLMNGMQTESSYKAY